MSGIKSQLPEVQGRLHLEVEEALNDSDKTLTVPTGARWMIQWIYVELTTTATVGNRQMELRFLDTAADTILSIVAGNTQAASLTYQYNFFPGAARDTTVVSSRLQTPIPLCILPAGYQIKIFDNAAVAAAADDMVIQMMVQEWMEE